VTLLLLWLLLVLLLVLLALLLLLLALVLLLFTQTSVDVAAALRLVIVSPEGGREQADLLAFLLSFPNGSMWVVSFQKPQGKRGAKEL
jgi:hypothetical protein